MPAVLIPRIAHWAKAAPNEAAVQRLLQQLPFALEDIRALIESVSTPGMTEPLPILAQIEVQASSLRTHASMLDLPQLTSAAAWLQGSAQYGAEQKQLRSALADCSRFLAEGTGGLQF